jgi:hypothetical protein
MRASTDLRRHWTQWNKTDISDNAHVKTCTHTSSRPPAGGIPAIDYGLVKEDACQENQYRNHRGQWRQPQDHNNKTTRTSQGGVVDDLKRITIVFSSNDEERSDVSSLGGSCHGPTYSKRRSNRFRRISKLLPWSRFQFLFGASTKNSKRLPKTVKFENATAQTTDTYPSAVQYDHDGEDSTTAHLETLSWSETFSTLFRRHDTSLRADPTTIASREEKVAPCSRRAPPLVALHHKKIAAAIEVDYETLPRSNQNEPTKKILTGRIRKSNTATRTLDYVVHMTQEDEIEIGVTCASMNLCSF